jgi:hypothetical protein
MFRYNCLVMHAKLLREKISISGGFFDSIACAGKPSFAMFMNFDADSDIPSAAAIFLSTTSSTAYCAATKSTQLRALLPSAPATPVCRFPCTCLSTLAYTSRLIVVQKDALLFERTPPHRSTRTIFGPHNRLLSRYNSSNLQRGLVMAAHTFCGQHVRVEVPQGWTRDAKGKFRTTAVEAKLLLSKIFLW